MNKIATELDHNGQPTNIGFNFSRNKDKALFGLKGILSGIVADQQLNEQELLFLDTWLRSQVEIRNDGDVVDLLDVLDQIFEDGIATKEELEDIFQLIDDVIEYKGYEEGSPESKINELLGLISGIAADEVVTKEEVLALNKWLQDNPDIKDKWPTNVLIKRLDEILEDGIIDDDEKTDLLEMIKQITGTKFEETGIAHGMATDFFEDPIDTISYKDSCFCFTGNFISGTRKTLEANVKKLGGETHSDVIKKVNYLVIGSLASRDWRQSSFGRKIEKALKYKQSGLPIYIITEQTWTKYSPSNI